MIPVIQLGSTDIVVSRLGLGTVKFGRNQAMHYPVSFELPTDKEIQNLLSSAKELGMNLLDTAPAYGISEERIGKALKGERQHWVISTKAGEEFKEGQSYFDFSSHAIRQSVLRSLHRLKTDYLDILLIHSNGKDESLILNEVVFQTLQEMKKAGWIRAFGISTKTVEGGLGALNEVDVVMLTYNPIQPEEKPVILEAAKKNKGILVKKALASGHLQKIGNAPLEKTMQFIFEESGVSSVILGTLNEEHLRYNVECGVKAMTHLKSSA